MRRLEDMPAETDKWIEILKPHSNRWWYRSIFIWPNKNQINGIQQANSNYEENKSSCSLSHSSTQSFEEKSEESPDPEPKSRHAEIRNMSNVF